MIPSYPSIHAVGHRAIAELFNGTVVIQEKVDGSQFSMHRTLSGELECRSKGQQIVVDAPEKLFGAAVDSAKRLNLVPGLVYRCEYLRVPRHNTLAYDKIPAGHFALFDVHYDNESGGTSFYMSPQRLREEAERLGIDVVPCLYHGPGQVRPGQATCVLGELLNRESFLGGPKVEGVVVKNYDRFGPDHHILVGKFVSQDFKEKHQHEWKKSNPSKSDVVEHLIGQLRTEARWRKAVQHLRERGLLTETPKDIGALLIELAQDVEREESDAVRDVLFKHFWPQIVRGIRSGFPEFYKKSIGIVG